MPLLYHSMSQRFVIPPSDADKMKILQCRLKQYPKPQRRDEKIQVYDPDDFDHEMDPPTFDKHRTTLNQVKLEPKSDSEELPRFRAGLPPASQPVELAEPVFTVTKLEELEYKIDVIEDGSVEGDQIKEEEEEEDKEEEDKDLFRKYQSCGKIPLPTRVARLKRHGFVVPSSWNSAGAICRKCGNRFRTYRRSLAPSGKEMERELTRKMKSGERAGENKTQDYDWYAWVDSFGTVIWIWRRNGVSDREPHLTGGKFIRCRTW
ncbi:hypothetical protein C8J56DRAFT_496742 [Mycena floridula]|nr:hypothetical protein C8J56DRAFT_496742 [Mycena floridula]